MKAEFTVIVEPQAGNGVVARIAEVPGVTVHAENAAQARIEVAKQLKDYFDRHRTDALQVANKLATVAKVRVATQPATPKKSKKSKYDLSLLEILHTQGRVDRIPSDEEIDEIIRTFKPIPLEGAPLSEDIIRDRR